MKQEKQAAHFEQCQVELSVKRHHQCEVYLTVNINTINVSFYFRELFDMKTATRPNTFFAQLFHPCLHVKVFAAFAIILKLLWTAQKRPHSIFEDIAQTTSGWSRQRADAAATKLITATERFEFAPCVSIILMSQSFKLKGWLIELWIPLSFDTVESVCGDASKVDSNVRVGRFASFHFLVTGMVKEITRPNLFVESDLSFQTLCLQTFCHVDKSHGSRARSLTQRIRLVY